MPKLWRCTKTVSKTPATLLFIFVGNIKPEEVEPLIATYLGALPSVNRKETFRDNHIDMRQGDYKNIFSKNWKRPKPLYWLSTMVNVHIPEKTKS